MPKSKWQMGYCSQVRGPFKSQPIIEFDVILPRAEGSKESLKELFLNPFAGLVIIHSSEECKLKTQATIIHALGSLRYKIIKTLSIGRMWGRWNSHTIAGGSATLENY